MSQSVPVLMYHHVSPNPGLVTVSPSTFAWQMHYLANAGYSALSADRFLAFLQRRESIPRKSVLITFDDGYLDNYVFAFPILQRHGLRATVFAVTSWITDGPVRHHSGEHSASGCPATPDHRACKAAIASDRADDVMLRWSEIERVESAGTMEIHSHTHSHIRWDGNYSDPEQRRSVVEDDLRQSKDLLRQRLGKDSRHLCWPWGYFEPDYIKVAEQIGFEAQYTTVKDVNTSGSDASRIARLVIKDRTGGWFANRMRIYSNSLLGRLYTKLRGNDAVPGPQS